MAVKRSGRIDFRHASARACDRRSRYGILAPAGTPPEVVGKLNAALTTVLAMPQLRDRFLTYGVEAKASTPIELHALIAAEIPSWRKVIEERNVKTE